MQIVGNQPCHRNGKGRTGHSLLLDTNRREAVALRNDDGDLPIRHPSDLCARLPKKNAKSMGFCRIESTSEQVQAATRNSVIRADSLDNGMGGSQFLGSSDYVNRAIIAWEKEARLFELDESVVYEAIEDQKDIRFAHGTNLDNGTYVPFAIDA